MRTLTSIAAAALITVALAGGAAEMSYRHTTSAPAGAAVSTPVPADTTPADPDDTPWGSD